MRMLPQENPPDLAAGRRPEVLDGREELRSASRALAARARREIRILTRDLDPGLYDDAQFLATLRDLAMATRRLAVRVLVFDPGPAVRRGHRLIELARRHSSFIAIRRVPASEQDRTDAFLLADERGYVFRPFSDLWEGTADDEDPITVRRLGAELERIWELAEEDVELRRLFL